MGSTEQHCTVHSVRKLTMVGVVLSFRNLLRDLEHSS